MKIKRVSNDCIGDESLDEMPDALFCVPCALKTHGKSLEEIDADGGMTTQEALANLDMTPLQCMSHTPRQAMRALVNRLNLVNRVLSTECKTAL